MNNPFAVYARHYRVIAALESDLRAGLERFWRTATAILNGSPVRLMQPDPSYYSLPRNFFSTLFLYSYWRLGVPAERRILYAAVNQCLRGMVTGCDNILDDEYKVTLETDLPTDAHRFRSVLDIMVADRVLFALMQDYCQEHGYPAELALQASARSLQALTLSGVQEASEEGGIEERLTPDQILRQVHHYKTGVLFQSTWAIPALFENEPSADAKVAQDALYHIGIGCQMLDDIVDLYVDVREQRHNYVASVIFHQEPDTLLEKMHAWAVSEPACNPAERFYESCPDFSRRMKAEALAMLEGGLHQLFADEHQALVRPAARFIASRIGVGIGDIQDN